MDAATAGMFAGVVAFEVVGTAVRTKVVFVAFAGGGAGGVAGGGPANAADNLY